jgi:RNA polymerase sigma-70 factor, ECF subfamily
MTNEQLLIEQLQNNETQQQAFRTLVETYQERLYWHIRRLVVDHDNADDVLQNAFVKIWRNIGAFRGESSLYTWMFRIATNEAISFINQQKKQANAFSGESSDFLRDNLMSDEYFDGTEIELKLQEAIALLPTKQRMVFNMKYFEEKKYNEMSELLNTSVGALKASYHHAVRKIEEFLSNQS